MIAEQLRPAEGPGSYVHVIVMVSSLHGNETQRHLSHLLMACHAVQCNLQKACNFKWQKDCWGKYWNGGRCWNRTFQSAEEDREGI